MSRFAYSRRMVRVVMAGGGVCGLLAAMLLAKDGHDVVVLERDEHEPPPPTEAWDSWERRGVNQFRLPHGLLPRFRREASAELPGVVERLIAGGAYESNMLGPGGPPEYDGVTARRPFVEACVAAEAAETPGVDVRRGVAVAGVTTGPEFASGIPHVTGVRLESGEEIAADLVIDSGGRRSALPRWLSAIGAHPPIEDREDAGFVYYGTHFQSNDGSQAAIGPVLRAFGSVQVLSLAGELGIWGVGIITASGDKELRCLKDQERWLNVFRNMPDCEHLLEGEQLHEIRVMSRIEDRYRRYVVDGEPVATGVVAVADAVAATNPSKGRGIAMGLLHVIGLRDALRDVGLDDPLEFSRAFDDVTENTITPHYRASVWDDRRRIAQIDAQRRGVAPDPGDDEWQRWNQFLALAQQGPPLLFRLLDYILLDATPAQILAEADVQSALDDAGEIEMAAPAGPTRGELLALAGV